MSANILLTVGMLGLLFFAAPAAADGTPLDAPWGLAGVYVPEGVQLAWNAPVATAHVDHYRVYRALNESSFTLYAEVDGTTYLDPQGDTAFYSYYVTAVWSGSESGPSNEAYAWPYCDLITAFPVTINPNPVKCFLPLPPSPDVIGGGAFIYRVPIARLQAVQVHVP